jgi:hypothetical protein
MEEEGLRRGHLAGGGIGGEAAGRRRLGIFNLFFRNMNFQVLEEIG